MTLRFNLNILEEASSCNAQELVELLKLHFNKKLVPKSSLARKPITNLQGFSFLLNPGPLFADKYTDLIFKAQYIRLAGRRDYAQYKYYGNKYLDLTFFSDIDISSIRYNPLLTIADNKIYFKYEEN